MENKGFISDIDVNKTKRSVTFVAGDSDGASAFGNPITITAKANSAKIVIEENGTQETQVLSSALPADILDPDKIEDIFWDWINPELDDPFLRDVDLEERQELCYSDKITAEDAERLFMAIAVLDPSANHPGLELTITSATEDTAAEVDVYPEGWVQDYTAILLEKALEYCDPQGWEWEYNDGARDRQSGYSRVSACVFSLDHTAPPSAHEKAELMHFLQQWAESQGPWDACVAKALNLGAAPSTLSSYVEKGAA